MTFSHATTRSSIRGLDSSRDIPSSETCRAQIPNGVLSLSSWSTVVTTRSVWPKFSMLCRRNSHGPQWKWRVSPAVYETIRHVGETTAEQLVSIAIRDELRPYMSSSNSSSSQTARLAGDGVTGPPAHRLERPMRSIVKGGEMHQSFCRMLIAVDVQDAELAVVTAAVGFTDWSDPTSTRECVLRAEVTP
jgi:hypothetical protein